MAVAVLPPYPPISPNTFVGGDTYFRDSTFLQWTSTECEFGRNDDKTPVNQGCCTLINPDSIPLGDIALNRAKFEVVPSESDSGAFTVDIDVLAPDLRLGASDIIDHDGQFILTPSSTVYPPTSIWDDSRVSGEDITLAKVANTGIGNVTQAWTCNTNGFMKVHYWYLERSGSLAGMSIRCDLYKADLGSSPGSYRRGDLVDTGLLNTTPDTLVNSGSPAIAILFYSGGLVGSGAAVTSGTTYVSELVTVGGNSALLGINLLSTAADGDTENLSLLAYTEGGARKLNSFQERATFLTGTRIKTAPAQGAADSVTAKDFTSGTLHGYGNPFTDSHTYSPADGGNANFTELPNFKGNLEAALKARTHRDQGIAIRMQDFNGGTDDRERHFRGSRHASTSVAPHKGLVLTVDYTLPGDFLRRYEHTPAPNPSLRR